MFCNFACVVRLLVLSSFLHTSRISSAAPVMRVVQANQANTELVTNGDFERMSSNKLEGWVAGPKGFALVVGEGRRGSQAVCCHNPSGRGWYGASQTITLNRGSVQPLVIYGWSKAANVSGSSDQDYSIYVDLMYADDTPLWGQTATFRAGTHDWERGELIILPEKPVKSITVHCLFRNHASQVWFDDISVTEAASQRKVLRERTRARASSRRATG